ncbi:phosphorothioated DNA-binding restriction endonuclease [Alteromonas sp. BMJM2]|uniref:phosphorothioated DNA-binding restriction endonuclease n=1 Tax=Alteromonas sp. BMJM2 TaxID=2954241 RepID=UPI0022B373DF|nr:HNH endonuclease [Alteromonas sp. BMJM2]
MTPNELRAAVLNVKRWSRADQRAPNKPLMMAYALAKYLQGHDQLFSYANEVDPDLHLLLQRFGPARRVYHPEYPFWRLINDGIWRLDNAGECLPRKSNNDPPKSELIKYGVLGGFSNEAYSLLKKDRQLNIDLLNSVLSDNFPESVVPDISAQLGLELAFKEVNKRDPKFRGEVLNAYNGRCAICGFDARLNNDLFAIEAAHIKWKQFNGPCSVNNGLALCSIHHKALNKGVIAFSHDMRLRISHALTGGQIIDELFWGLEGKQIFLPRNKNFFPTGDYIEWHEKNVFHK